MTLPQLKAFLTQHQVVMCLRGCVAPTDVSLQQNTQLLVKVGGLSSGEPGMRSPQGGGSLLSAAMGQKQPSREDLFALQPDESAAQFQPSFV